MSSLSSVAKVRDNYATDTVTKVEKLLAMSSVARQQYFNTKAELLFNSQFTQSGLPVGSYINKVGYYYIKLKQSYSNCIKNLNAIRADVEWYNKYNQLTD